jgi:hypothetical protein
MADDQQSEDKQMSEMLMGIRGSRREPIKFAQNPTMTETPIDFIEKMVTPSKMKDSDSHDFIVRDPGLSKLPTEQYAEMMADYTRVASMFKELGYPKIGKVIHAEMEQKAWALMGVGGWLRDKMNETRGVFIKSDVSSSQPGIRYGLDKLR